MLHGVLISFESSKNLKLRAWQEVLIGVVWQRYLTNWDADTVLYHTVFNCFDLFAKSWSISCVDCNPKKGLSRDASSLGYVWIRFILWYVYIRIDIQLVLYTQLHTSICAFVHPHAFGIHLVGFLLALDTAPRYHVLISRLSRYINPGLTLGYSFLILILCFLLFIPIWINQPPNIIWVPSPSLLQVFHFTPGRCLYLAEVQVCRRPLSGATHCRFCWLFQDVSTQIGS